MDNSLENDEKAGACTIYWRIENFQYESGSRRVYLSTPFHLKAFKSLWQIEIRRRDDCLSTKFILRPKENKSISNTLLTFTISLLTGNGWRIVLDSDHCIIDEEFTGYRLPCLISYEELRKEEWNNLPNGSLTVSFCVRSDCLKNKSLQRLMISRLTRLNALLHRPIEFFTSLKSIDLHHFPLSYDFQNGDTKITCSKKVKTKSTQTNKIVACENLEEMCKSFQSLKLNFVTLRTPNKEFSVLKEILCAKSPVFKAMFERNMRESDSNSVDIDDIDSKTMETLVKFLHNQPLEGLGWDSAVTLYYAADKYQIESLKEACVTIINQELSVENICDTFLLADIHLDEVLMRCAQDFFCKNSKLILRSPQWKELLPHTELVAEILHKLAENL